MQNMLDIISILFKATLLVLVFGWLWRLLFFDLNNLSYLRHPAKAIKQMFKKADCHTLIQSFNSSKSGDEAGRNFVELTRVGFFQNQRTLNHGNSFPDKRQCQEFLKYSTEDVAKALKEVGDSFETFVV